MQPAGVNAEPLDRARRDSRAEILRIDREGLQRPAETIIVQQRRRDPEQLMHRRPGRPTRDVIERRRRTQPARDQRTHDLADRQDRPGAAGQRPVNRALNVELAQEVLDEQQRADTDRRVPAIGGSSLANDPASASSCPESFSASFRPRFATTRWRTLPFSSR